MATRNHGNRLLLANEQMNFFIFLIKMLTFSKKFQPKTFFRIKEPSFNKLFFKINCFEKYSEKTKFAQSGRGVPLSHGKCFYFL